jgi:serine/threonine protein kinase
MEFMEGGTVRDLLLEMEQLPKKAARFYAAEIILAANFLHKCGIVHR